MRLYLVDGQWQSYEDLHNNYGYTKQATKNILTFKSTDIDAWGEILINVPGFYTITDDSERWDGEFFVSDHTGWYTMDELGYHCGCMPLEVDTTDLQFYNGTSVSKAAKVNFDPPGEGAQVDKYLLQAELERGWLTEEEWAELDWLKGEPEPEIEASLFILDNTTGKILHSSIGIMGYIPHTEIHRVPEDSVRFIEPLLLPNVTYVYTIVDNGNRVISLGSNEKVKLLTDSSSALILYDSTKVYHTNVGSGSGTTYRTEFGTISIDGNVGIINRSDNSLNAFGCTTYISDSLDTEITQVVKTADDSVYTAFKYIDNGTSYYYVLDGVQSSWTDDLSSIGYTEKDYIEMAIYSSSPYRNGGVTSSSMPGGAENAYDRNGDIDSSGWYPDYYYYWDFSKRYEFGWYDNGVWVPYPQTLADMPVAADTDHSFIILPRGERYIYIGWNNSDGAYLVNKKFRCHMYHDTFSVWQNSGHTDQYPDISGLVTDILYDSTKVYKALYMLTEAGALVNITDLYKVTFSEDNGYLKITVPNGTSDQFAKFVLYTIDAHI